MKTRPSNYQFFCAILYVLRTGVSWRDVPECYGSWHTIYTRFKRWSESGWFWKLLQILQTKKLMKIDFVWVDSTTIAVHRHGSGALKKSNQLVGRRKKGLSTKLHLALSLSGIQSACLSEGQQVDMKVFPTLWQAREWEGIQYIIADKGYDYFNVRHSIKQAEKTPVISRRANTVVPGLPAIYKPYYRSRFAIERFFGRIKENKHLALRFDKLISTFFSFFALAAIKSLNLIC